MASRSYRLPELITVPDGFTTHAASVETLRAACHGSEVARFVEYGRSEEDRPLVCVIAGHGPAHVSLVAGAHADEPVGPEMLRALALSLVSRPDGFGGLLGECTLLIVPHVNPDGEARNRPWIDAWPRLESYLTDARREPPGRDVEFGYPNLRPENTALSELWRDHAPFGLHMSLHGMGFSDGAMLLIERHWPFRTRALREDFTAAAAECGLLMHDHNREGEKGFFYIAPGYTTTPEGEAMRAYFDALGDADMAGRFLDSSMEFVRSLGGDPLCLVTELPLFVVDGAREPGNPNGYLSFRASVPELRARLSAGQSVDIAGVRPLSLRDAVRLQLIALELGLESALGISFCRP